MSTRPAGKVTRQYDRTSGIFIPWGGCVFSQIDKVDFCYRRPEGPELLGGLGACPPGIFLKPRMQEMHFPAFYEVYFIYFLVSKCKCFTQKKKEKKEPQRISGGAYAPIASLLRTGLQYMVLPKCDLQSITTSKWTGDALQVTFGKNQIHTYNVSNNQQWQK